MSFYLTARFSIRCIILHTVFTLALPIPLFLSRLDLTGDGVVSLSANHLAKLRLSFQLTTSHGHAFKPQQVVLPFQLANFMVLH